MKTGTVLKNLWAGYETYFICMNFPANSFKSEARKTCGFSLVCVDGNWRFDRAEYYVHSLKDSEHYPVVGRIDVCKMFVDAINGLVSDAKGEQE